MYQYNNLDDFVAYGKTLTISYQNLSLTEIFNDIKEMTDQEINASWVAEDPMNASGQTKNIQFVGLYDDNMNLKNELNTANAGESDTASYNETKRIKTSCKENRKK